MPSTSRCYFRFTQYFSVLRNKTGVANNADEIEKLKKICKELEQKTINNDNKISDMNVELENLNMNIKLSIRELNDSFEDRKLHF